MSYLTERWLIDVGSICNSSQPNCVDTIGFVAALEEVVLARIADDQFGDQRFYELIEPGRRGAFFEGQVDRASDITDEIVNFLREVSVVD